MSDARDKALEAYVLEVGGDHGHDPSIERIVRTDVYVVREVFRAGWDAAKADLPADAHFECNCVPELGPPHCHACGEAAGRPVPWTEAAHGPVPDRAEVAKALMIACAERGPISTVNAEGVVETDLTPLVDAVLALLHGEGRK